MPALGLSLGIGVPTKLASHNTHLWVLCHSPSPAVSPGNRDQSCLVEVTLMSWQSKTRVSCSVRLSHSSGFSHQAKGA